MSPNDVERWIIRVGEEFFEFTHVKNSRVVLTKEASKAWPFRSREAAVSKRQMLEDRGFENVRVARREAVHA